MACWGQQSPGRVALEEAPERHWKQGSRPLFYRRFPQREAESGQPLGDWLARP